MNSVQSDWVPRFDGIPPDEKPIKLGDEYVNFIIDSINTWTIRGPCQRANDVLHENIKNNIRSQLGKVRIVPRIEYIEQLVTDIHMMYERALAEDGSAVGYAAATSISSASTQSTMKSFALKSGASSAVEGGVAGLSVLVYTRLTRKNDAKMIVHFNTEVTQQDVIDLRAILVELKVDTLVANYEIGQLSPVLGQVSLNSLERFWWHDLQLRNPAIPEFKSMSPSTYVLRLYLDSVALFAYKTTPREVAEVIRKVKGDGIFALYSPLSHSIVDVVIIPENNYSKPTIESEQITFLRQVIYQKLNGITVKGVTGIKEIFPKTIKLTDCILGETDNADGTFTMNIGNTFPRVFESLFPPYHFLERFIRRKGIMIRKKIRHDYTRKIIGFLVESKTSPTKLLKSQPDDTYTYMITSGYNFDSILKFPWVDPLRSTPNDIFEIAAKMGIEASREYFLYELSLVLESIKSKDINSRHINLLTDFIFIEGIPSGTRSGGNTSHNQGSLTAASRMKGGIILTKAAINSDSENITNTTPSMVVGTVVSIGKKVRNVDPTPEYIAELRKAHSDKKERKNLILQDLHGTKIAIRENNQRLREALMKKISQKDADFRVEITIPKDVQDFRMPVETIADEPPNDIEVSRINFLPVIVSEAHNAIMKAAPTILQTTPTSIPQVSIEDIESDIRPIATRPKLHNISFYIDIFGPKTPNFAVDSRWFGNIPNIIENYLPIISDKQTRKVTAPIFDSDVNIYDRKDNILLDVITVKAPKMFEASNKIYYMQRVPFPVMYPQVMTHGSNLDSMLSSLENVEMLKSILRMP